MQKRSRPIASGEQAGKRKALLKSVREKLEEESEQDGEFEEEEEEYESFEEDDDEYEPEEVDEPESDAEPEEDDDDDEEEEEEYEEVEDDEDEPEPVVERPSPPSAEPRLSDIPVVQASQQDVGPEEPPAEDEEDLFPPVKLRLTIECDSFKRPMETSWNLQDTEILEKSHSKVQRYLKMLPPHERIDFHIELQKTGGGRPIPGDDSCMKEDFVECFMEQLTTIEKRYRWNATKNPDSHWSAKKKTEELPPQSDLTMQEALVASMQVMGTGQKAMAAINEVYETQKKKRLKDPKAPPTSLIAYLGHPDVQALMADNEAMDHLAAFFGMQTTVNLIRSIGGPVAKISAMVNAYSMMKAQGGGF